MVKIYSLFISLLLITFTVQAQETYNKGVITLKNGKTTEGYIQINY